jgi:oxygen-dependent protoporphyrinogen oxidase
MKPSRCAGFILHPLSFILAAMPRIVIVGAGISGLAAAFHLQEALPAADIQILEASDRPGGTIWTERRDGFQVEVGANGFLDNNPSTLDLCRRLGLADRLLLASDAAKHRYLFVGDKLQKLPESLLQFVGSPLLSWRGKLALLMERYRQPRRGDCDESVHDFAARRASEEVADVFADALVTGIHAGDPKLLSMRATFPRFVRLEEEHGSLLRAISRLAKKRRAEAKARDEQPRSDSRLLSFREGLRLLIETLRDRLRTLPLFGVRVQRIGRAKPSGWIVRGEGQDQWPTDAVVLACPSYRQAMVLADLDPALAAAIDEIPYAAAVVVALGYRKEDVPHNLDGFGFITPQRTRRDILGVQWCSSIYPDRAPPGHVLMRAIVGGWHRRDIAGWSDERLIEAVRSEFRLTMGITKAPVFQHITRWENAIPQYHLGHLEKVAKIEALAAAHQGLFLSGNAYHGVAMNDCTEQAARSAERVAAFLLGSEQTA